MCAFSISRTAGVPPSTRVTLTSAGPAVSCRAESVAATVLAGSPFETVEAAARNHQSMGFWFGQVPFAGSGVPLSRPIVSPVEEDTPVRSPRPRSCVMTLSVPPSMEPVSDLFREETAVVVSD